jgi:hypothetical protein
VRSSSPWCPTPGGGYRHRLVVGVQFMQFEHPLLLGGLSRLGAWLGIGQGREAVLNTGTCVRLPELAATRLARLASEALVGTEEAFALLLLPSDGAASSWASSCVGWARKLRRPGIVVRAAAGQGATLPEDASLTTIPRTLRTTTQQRGGGALFWPACGPTRCAGAPKVGLERAADPCGVRSTSEPAASCLSQVVPVDPIGRMIPSAHCGNRRAECGANYGKVADS